MDDIQYYYRAMFRFLEKEYNIGKSEDISYMLSNMQLLVDGDSADPAYWDAWKESLEEVKADPSIGNTTIR